VTLRDGRVVDDTTLAPAANLDASTLVSFRSQGA
jgi:hypothetical protein